ncbi:MAG TPA: ArsC/Spx/MgsR family protein [Anaeromyxobacter sp.]|nr:ArsC/Spx/MgsR family protein [Anaeromyxobacter sp.]
MAGEYVLWFDARSSACRRALDLLQERGVEPALRRYLQEPPSEDEVRALLERLRVPAHQVIRMDEDEAQVLRLSDRTPEDELVAAIATHPRILERPILVAGDRALVARPPERMLALLATPREVSGA